MAVVRASTRAILRADLITVSQGSTSYVGGLGPGPRPCCIDQDVTTTTLTWPIISPAAARFIKVSNDD